MGASVLLLNPNRSEAPYPVYPVGLAYLARTLTDAGQAVAVWDARMSPETLATVLAREDPAVIAISVRNIDNVQSHHSEWFVADLVEFCRQVRAASVAPIVLGGSGFSLFPEPLLALTEATYGLVGEAEEAAVELVEALETGVPRRDLPGLVWRDGEDIRVNPPPTCGQFEVRVPLHDPALVRAYVAAGSPIGLQTQRGCVLRCCYCTYPLLEGRCMRHRTPASVATEFAELAALGVPYVFFVDSVFNLVPRHAAGICEALRANGSVLPWGAFLRPHRIGPAQAALFREAGMQHAEFGSDSLNDAVLQAYRKSFTVADILGAHAALDRTGVHCSHFIIAGGPGETAATLEDTLARSRTLANAVFFAAIGMRVYPHTPLWEAHCAAGGDPDPTAYLAPVFYLSPGLAGASVQARLEAHAADHPNWIIGDPPPAFKAAADRLRARGKCGPLWEYIEVLQRMAPPSATN